MLVKEKKGKVKVLLIKTHSCTSQDTQRPDQAGCIYILGPALQDGLQQTDEPTDCEMTTTESPPTPQPTVEVGCCKGDSAKSNDKCNAKAMRGQCDRSSSCHWIADGVVDVDCVIDDPSTTVQPGCCYGNPDSAYSARWMAACTGYFSERECLMLTDDDSAARCVWEDQSEEYDCSQLWPTTTSTSTPTEETGCCDSDIAKKFDQCNAKDSKSSCERSSSCFWTNGDDAVCDAPDIEEGCCYGDSYKANDKCLKATDKDMCARNGCSWMATEDPTDCELTTTTDHRIGLLRGHHIEEH